LRSPVIRADKKQNIIEAITKDKVSTTTSIFTRLLVAKGRESDLPEIISAFVDQYNMIRGIHRVKLTTAVPVGEEVQKTIIEKTKNEAGLTNVELETAVNEKLIGGFVLEFSNNLVDASILSDLKALKKEFSSNVYIQKIR
jgi:F-type H+-transporting ATPase subunit delta